MTVHDLRPIWLPKDRTPDFQRSFYTVECDRSGFSFCVAEFTKTFEFAKPVRSLRLLVCADTRFRLWCGSEFVGCGPVAGGGDFLIRRPLPKQYCCQYTLAGRQSAELFAQVLLTPDVLTDYSCGHGCFALCLEAAFEDGTVECFGTDESWQCRVNPAYTDTETADFTLSPEAWMSAEPIDNIWNFVAAPIPMLHEEFVAPRTPVRVCAEAGETVRVNVSFDRIYSGYVCFRVRGVGRCRVTVETYELPDNIVRRETVTAAGDLDYRGLRLQSLGGYYLTVRNDSAQPVTVENIGQIFTCYPVSAEGDFCCSDEMLNRIYRLGKHTLKICRQTLHLDSPLHQEPLACTGDYFIENLMNTFTFGDPRLTRLDVVRTADVLTMNDGRMFHTTYSLIWVQLLWDYYRFTADASVFAETRQALRVLLERFAGYLGDSGLIENPPDYMFVDWMNVDDYNLHHPPKALGQTVLNAFYYKALTTAALICREAGQPDDAALYEARAAALRVAFARFFDPERGLYVAGFNTPERNPGKWLPENTDRVYYTVQANTLAALYGLCEPETARAILRKVADGTGLLGAQPYFMHFVLEAVAAAGLFPEYGLSMLHQWDKQVLACEKGLKEGWGEFEGDFSHAWGGTPTYQLPCRLLGFEMLRPGFAEISLSPCLYGLESADISMPTPYGMLSCRLRKGEPPAVEAPREITVRLNGRPL